MSARSGIAKALAEGMAEKINGTGIYVSNLFGNTTNRVMHFDSITDFPYVSVTPGTEARDDKPSNFTWSHLTIYIRIYIENAEDAQLELETLITDIENYVDTSLRIPYQVQTTSGVVTRTTATNNITSIGTDEGLLHPNALGEIILNVQYEKIRHV